MIAIPLLIALAGVLIPAIVATARKNGDNVAEASKKGNFWQTIKDVFHELFKWKIGPQGQISDTDLENESSEDAWSLKDMPLNPYEGTSRIDMPNNQSAGTLNIPSQSSAQANAQSSVDAGSVSGYIQDTDNGGSAQNSDETVNQIKHIMAALGLSSLFGNDDDDFQFKSYSDIVNDERKYGSGMIADARRWEEYMSSTAYQRAVKDIEAAGLNPWLAVQSGSLSPASWGSPDSGSALGNISTSLSQSLSNSNSNSTSAILVALIMLLAKGFSK